MTVAAVASNQKGAPLKIIIAGAGIAGLSLAWALSRRGHAVSVYEQGPIPNPVSSSFEYVPCRSGWPQGVRGAV